MIRTKRAYASPEGSDGERLLVDRLWPRGVTMEAARNNAVAIKKLIENLSGHSAAT